MAVRKKFIIRIMYLCECRYISGGVLADGFGSLGGRQEVQEVAVRFQATVAGEVVGWDTGQPEVTRRKINDSSMTIT